MYRYMEIAYGDNGLAQYGKRMEVELLSNGKEGDEELTNGMLVVIFGNKDGEEVEIWTSRDGRLLAWQHSFSDGVAKVLSHKVESGLEVKRSKVIQSKSARDGSNASADELPKNDAGFLIGVARSFLRGGELPPDEDEEYLRERRHKARDTLSWASRRKEEITAARAARTRRGGRRCRRAPTPSTGAGRASGKPARPAASRPPRSSSRAARCDRASSADGAVLPEFYIYNIIRECHAATPRPT